MESRSNIKSKLQASKLNSIIYGKLKEDIGKILRQLCEWKQVNIIEAELCKDHIHMLVEIPPKMSVSGFVGFLKGKSSLLIHERHVNLKYKYGNREFWCRGHDRQKHEEDCGIHLKPIAGGPSIGSDQAEGIQ